MRSKLGLGSVQFGLPYGISNKGGQVPLSEVGSILNTAQHFGINTIDTAFVYGNAEAVLGTFEMNRFEVVSKFMPSAQYGEVSKQFSNTLADLKVNGIYGYLAHRTEDVFRNPDQWEVIKNLKQAGKVQKIGFSINSLAELELILNWSELPDLVQLPFNYFDNRFVDAMKYLKEKGVEIHVRSVFLQGLFFLSPDSLIDYFSAFRKELQKLRDVAGNQLAPALLKYVVQKEYVDVAIVGIQTAVQLEEIIKHLELAPDLPGILTRFEEEILMPSNWPK